ncbi:unnamed protein product [Chrysodeixis includens]|uniref:F-box domain-containing protein n=1 Tax=Chrysodeixis includens TaxID=689277 RepID=A0A9P0BT88_CHRIL|nr:unnamed protein product [Chrysodeixis includens]
MTSVSNNLLTLPVDILILIFKKLQSDDLGRIMQTCKTLNNLVQNSNAIWRSLPRNRLMLRDKADSRKFNNLSWYERCRASYNWCNGYFKQKPLVHFYSKYMPWLDFHNSEALLVSVGSEIHCYLPSKKGLQLSKKRAWKLEIPKINRHDIRTNDISRFVVKNDFIICGNRDGCVTVCRKNNIQSRPRIECHIRDCHYKGAAEVSAVEAIDNRGQLVIVSVSSDASNLCLCSWRSDEDSDIITIPDQDSKNVVNIYHGHVGAKCIALNKAQDKLAIGPDGNCRPLLLDVNNAQFLMDADDTKMMTNVIRDIQWHDENSIIFVNHKGFLQMIDIRSHDVIYNGFDPFLSSLYCLKTDGKHGIVVGSSEYSRCTLYDLRSRPHVQMYFTQCYSSPVYCLDFDSTKLITAVDRGIGILNFDVDPSTERQKDYSHKFFP